ncbi:MAG: hypothetical protein WC879_03525 [Melioribacteraceae bacterium]
MIRGIWPRNLSIWNLNKLYDEGFNSVILYTGYFWNLQEKPTVEKTVFLIWHTYQEAKILGYKFFLIDIGWGLFPLAEYDKTWLLIADRFRDCDDIYFYLGEPYEQWVENRMKYKDAEGKEQIVDEQKFNQLKNFRETFINQNTKSRLIFDSTARNKLRLKANALSSYCNQKKYWSGSDLLHWIYGQLKIGGSLRYKSLAKFRGTWKLTPLFIYQGDAPEWSWTGWINKILSIFGLLNWFEKLQRKRFLKWFNK